MKQYVIDEIRPADHAKLKAYLDEHHGVPGFDGLYHFPVAGHVLDDVQIDHADCGPHYVALELMPDRLSCELLVRTNQRIRCDCIRYATQAQRNWLIRNIDQIFQELDIVT